MKKVLVTGGAGFIGSNFIQYMLREEPEIELLVNLDLLTYAGNLENLLPVKDDKRYVFVHGDIRDRQLVEDISPDTGLTRWCILPPSRMSTAAYSSRSCF